MISAEPEFRWSPSWRVERNDQALTVTAGADLAYTVGDLTEAEDRELATYLSGDAVVRPAAQHSALFDQLVTIGVLEPVFPEDLLCLAIAWAGDELPGLVEEMQSSFCDSDPREVDVVLVVRTNATWSQTLDALTGVAERPYLFVDLAYHHTFSIGPLAIPGSTACAGCLAGRIRERWGDTEPPPLPAVHTQFRLIAAVIDLQLGQLASQVNAVSTWDLSSGMAKREPLYRVPRCPHCSTPADGQVSIPWVQTA